MSENPLCFAIGSRFPTWSGEVLTLLSVLSGSVANAGPNQPEPLLSIAPRKRLISRYLEVVAASLELFSFKSGQKRLPG